MGVDRTRPKVVFLIMAYNEEKYIERAMKSILNQTEKNILLYVRNNGSTDKTQEIIEKIAEQDDRVYWVANQVNGIRDDGGTFMLPIPENPNHRGEYYAIVDADDYILPEFTELMYTQAKREDADLVACANLFVDHEGNIKGDRRNVNAVYSDLHDIGDDFPILYNCFRTWWAKLYKCDFFHEFFSHAWTYTEPMKWFLDTIMTVNYLKVCRKLVCIDEALYCMEVRSDSTYSTRPMDRRRILEAYSLYNNNLDFLNKHGLNTSLNIYFNKMIHWAYLSDALKSYESQAVSNVHKLRWLKVIINDNLFKTYMYDKFEMIWAEIQKYLSIIKLNASESLYFDYLMRLEYFVDIYMQSPNNVLCLPILLGCVSDSENRNFFGSNLFQLAFEDITSGFISAKKMHSYVWETWYLEPEEFVDYLNQIDYTEEVRLKEERLVDFMNNEEWEEAIDLMGEIGRLCPFSKTTLISRVVICMYIGEYELAIVLISSMRNIWKNDNEIKSIYDDIYERFLYK